MVFLEDLFQFLLVAIFIDSNVKIKILVEDDEIIQFYTNVLLLIKFRKRVAIK